MARVAASLAACAAIVAACSGDGAAPAPESDGGIGDGAVGTAICPKVAPDDGSVCLLPEGTSCAFDACGNALALCTRGVWRFATTVDAPPVCPSSPPDIDEPCPVCWPKGATCVYGSEDCSAADASLNRSVASCVGDKWTLAIQPCLDAGADVQGDADEDAD